MIRLWKARFAVAWPDSTTARRWCRPGHTGSRGAGGPHQGLDGIRLKLQHPLQVKRLGVPLDGGLPPLLGGASLCRVMPGYAGLPSPAVGRGQPQVFPCRLKHLLIPAFRNPGKAGASCSTVWDGAASPVSRCRAIAPSNSLRLLCRRSPVGGSRPGSRRGTPIYTFQALAASGLIWPRGRFDVGRGAWPRPRPPPTNSTSPAQGHPSHVLKH